MALTVTLPIAAPTDLQATLVAGGSLAANTTYYYVVIAYDQNYYSPNGNTRYCFHSPISAEGSFTTDSTNKGVKINWTNVVGATRYQILLTTTSGDYTNSGGYGTAVETLGSITSGTVGYTITALSTETHIFHHIQIVNDQISNIGKHLGLLKVQLSGNETITLQQVYDSIIAAGYSDYVFYDGYNFVLKGWILVDYTENGTGTFYVERKRLIFIKGGVINNSPTYTIRFGSWINDLSGANYNNACSIDIQNSRYAFTCAYSGRLQLYGCVLTFGHSIITTKTENKSTLYYLTNGACVTRIIDEFNDTIIGGPGRSIISDVKDLKWYQSNNFGNYNHIRLKIYGAAAMPYKQGGKFYACDFVLTSALSFYNGVGYNTKGFYTDFYDCNWPARPDGMLYLYYGSIVNPTTLTSNQYTNVNYSVNATILDEEGNALSGVNVSALDAQGEPVDFIEYDSTIDKLVTGNIFAGNVTTDENGQIGYYINSYRVELNPNNTTYPTSYDTITTTKYPFTITFSKAGYKDYTVIIEELKKKTDMTLTLEYTEPIISEVNITNCTKIDEIDGEIQITATLGVEPYEYSLNGTDYQASNIFSNLDQGIYTVYIKDSINNVDSISGIKIVEPPYENNPKIDSVDILDASDKDKYDGQITVNASGINTPIIYSINGVDYQSSNVFSNLNTNYYTIYIKDVRNNIVTMSNIFIGYPQVVVNTVTTTEYIPLSDYIPTYDVDEGPDSLIYRRVIDAQGYRCPICSIRNVWNKQTLYFNWHYVDGNNKNKAVTNLRLICSNCKSQFK